MTQKSTLIWVEMLMVVVGMWGGKSNSRSFADAQPYQDSLESFERAIRVNDIVAIIDKHP